jgi:DNA-binding XRE family transcriptional regulator
MNEINRNLIEFRDRLNLSQQDCAVLMGVSRTTYIKWEKDIGTMPIGRYEHLMSVFEELEKLRQSKEGNDELAKK